MRRLNLTFNGHGDVIYFVGQPKLLDSSVLPDEDVLNHLDKYRSKVAELNNQIVGQSKVILDGDFRICRHKECNFGNLITDALFSYKASVSPQKWREAPIALFNGGSIRNTIEPVNGDVTKGELLGATPFGNQIVTVTLNGSNLIKTLEIGARSNGETSFGEFLQVSGLRVVLDMSKPPMSRVVSVQARCGTCNVLEYEEVEPSKNYTMVTTSFLALDGGDGHYVLTEYGFNKIIEKLNDVDTVSWYIGKYSPVEPRVEGRIILVECNGSDNFSGFGEMVEPSRYISVMLILYSLLINIKI
ncbi:hypothetical protein NQ314_013001 [Rhamnusium bicolor]|uniref:5'-nucleotidase n=1 Tax=Rhamnusium bicolor TaxID=1586634 RepID=A0AAV8X976_9CUCU|nr:hypothetical protein NQ314_013001 [Rhamnusium bicolor]